MRAWRGPAALWTTFALGTACGGASTTNTPSDAGVETPDVGVPSTLDASLESGTTDAGTDAEASFCEKNGAGHDFCEDFDRPVQIGGGRWVRTQVDESTARLLQENGYLRAEVLKIDAAAGVFAPAWLWAEAPWPRLADQSRPRVVLRYKLWVEECPVSGVSGPTIMAGVDRDPFYSWTIDTLAYQDIDCRMVLQTVMHRDIDGAPKFVLTASAFVAVPTKQWVDVTVEAKEQADNLVKATLRVGSAVVTHEFAARSQIDLLSLLFGASKNTAANISARYRLDDLLFDYTKP